MPSKLLRSGQEGFIRKFNCLLPLVLCKLWQVLFVSVTGRTIASSLVLQHGVSFTPKEVCNFSQNYL